MNLLHRWLCASDRWKSAVESQIMPWVLNGVDLGRNVLEVGPGPGLTTDVLRHRVEQLTCVEIHPAFAEALQRRTAGGNVTVRCEDATAMSLAAESFDSAVCFTMLHHVPSAELQDRLLREVRRVLRPGGVFVGRDSRYSRMFGLLHVFDTMTVVDPVTFPQRLEAAGFEDVHVDCRPEAFRFRARRPAT